MVGIFPNEASASTLATEIALRSSEEWTLSRYLTMEALETAENPKPTTFETLTRIIGLLGISCGFCVIRKWGACTVYLDQTET